MAAPTAVELWEDGAGRLWLHLELAGGLDSEEALVLESPWSKGGFRSDASHYASGLTRPAEVISFEALCPLDGKPPPARGPHLVARLDLRTTTVELTPASYFLWGRDPGPAARAYLGPC